MVCGTWPGTPPQVLDSRLVSVAADKVWVGSGVGAPVLDMAETVPPGTRSPLYTWTHTSRPTKENIVFWLKQIGNLSRKERPLSKKRRTNF